MDLSFAKRDEMILYIAEAFERYRKAGIGIGRVGFGKKPAVLVIDLQYAFASPESPLGGNLDQVVENVRTLIEEARRRGVPVVYTAIIYRQKDGLDCGLWKLKIPTLPKVCSADSRFVEIDERLKPQPGEYVVEKKMASGFSGTELLNILNSLDVDTVVVVGGTTSGCVRATVVDAISYGFRPIVPEDCVGDRSEGPHKAALFDMATKYADVVRLAEVLENLKNIPRKD